MYQSRGKIVFAVHPYGICDTLNGDLHFDLGEPAMGYGKDGTLHLVFISSRDTIYYMKKVPGGGWSQPIIVAGAMAGDHLAHPSIAVDSDGYVHVVYLVSGVHDNRIEYRYFYSDSSMTSTISAPEVVSSVSDTTFCIPVIDVTPRSVKGIGIIPVVVWRDHNFVLITKRVKEKWEARFIVAKNVTDGAPSFNIDKSNGLNIVWQSANCLYFKRLGIKFDEDVKPEIAAYVEGRADPYLFNVGGVVYVVFSSEEGCDNPYTDSLGPVSNILLAERVETKTGAIWSVNRVTTTCLNSRYPQALVEGNKIVLMWTEGGYNEYRVAIDTSLSAVPEVYVLTPGDGFLYSYGDSIEVEWVVRPSASGLRVHSHYIYYSEDGGETYTFLDSLVFDVDSEETLSVKELGGWSVTDSFKVRVISRDISGAQGADHSRGLAQVWWMVSDYSGATAPNTPNIVSGGGDSLHLIYSESDSSLTYCVSLGVQRWDKVFEDSVMGQGRALPLIRRSGDDIDIFYLSQYEFDTCVGEVARLGCLCDGQMRVLVFDSAFCESGEGYGLDAVVRGDTVYCVYCLGEDGASAGRLYYSEGDIGVDTILESILVDTGITIRDTIADLAICLDSMGGRHVFYVKSSNLMYAYAGDTWRIYSVNDVPSPFSQVRYLSAVVVGDTVCVVYQGENGSGQTEIVYAEKVISDSGWNSEVVADYEENVDKSYPTLVGGSLIMWSEFKEEEENSDSLLGVVEREGYLLVSYYEGDGQWSEPDTLYKSENRLIYPSGYLEDADSGYVLHAVWTEGRGPYKMNYGVFNVNLSGLRGGPMGRERKGMYPFMLRLPRPNPSGDRVVIDYSVPTDGDVELEVYDVAGRRVRELVKGRVKAGIHRLEWNRKSDMGRLLPSGVYFIRLEAEGRRAVRKVVLMR